ncbi:peptidase M48 [Novimethylophilus kurashikiensis]|uniref:Peptidase M48 n=1 Tax=Novimethylophilus kurashikiensis TaxID=1825523 RepID=A0A2R5FCQ2_9PROT|nr:M48 family metalloprotease [Novimethylophilus kurashikiensis]GBG14491.1 peptidase M48 [Novimethylophilus kurashikiensis]
MTKFDKAVILGGIVALVCLSIWGEFLVAIYDRSVARPLDTSNPIEVSIGRTVEEYARRNNIPTPAVRISGTDPLSLRPWFTNGVIVFPSTLLTAESIDIAAILGHESGHITNQDKLFGGVDLHGRESRLRSESAADKVAIALAGCDAQRHLLTHYRKKFEEAAANIKDPHPSYADRLALTKDCS